jgi:hypothetical protein
MGGSCRSKRIDVHITTDASGAALAGSQSRVVVIVDVIDMSTTLESALDAGAAAVFGASPAGCRAPVTLNPEAMGFAAGREAVKLGTEVVVVAEPRVGTEAERRGRAAPALGGLARAGARVRAVLPNLGSETPKLADLAGTVVLAVTDTGGVAFEAAFHAGGIVTIGTIARTWGKKGEEPARAAAARAVDLALAQQRGITVVAASGNALEDILAGQYLTRLIGDRLTTCPGTIFQPY